MILFFYICILMTLFFPIISLPINIISLLILKKYRKYIIILISLSLASIAYVWVPGIDKDLYRWHLKMIAVSKYKICDLVKLFLENYEFINYFLMSYIYKIFQNINLLQFFVAFVGYYELLWILCDYTSMKKSNNLSFVIGFIFVFSSLKYIDFISGLWFYFSIINFALGYYLSNIKGTKFVQYVFYSITFLSHISTLFILCLLLVLYISRFISKIRYSIIIVLFIFLILIGPIILFLYNRFDTSIVRIVYHFYESYIISGNRFSNLHDGSNLYLSLIRIVISSLILFLQGHENTKYRNFTIYFITATVAILFNAHVFIRYTYLIQLLIIPFIVDYFNTKLTKNKIIILVLVLLSSSLMLYKNYSQIEYSGIIKNISDNLNKSIFYIIHE